MKRSYFFAVSMIKLLILMVFIGGCHVGAADSGFPKPTKASEIVPKIFDRQVAPLQPTEVFFYTDDHVQVFLENLPTSEERAKYIRASKISSGHPLFKCKECNIFAQFESPPMPQAFLRQTTFWENVWSQGLSPNQTVAKGLKVRVGASRQTVEAFTQVVADVKIDVANASASASSTVNQHRLTYTIEEERIEEESMNLVTSPTESAVFTMWQRVDILEIVDQQGNPINHSGLWRIYENGGAIWQAVATYTSPQPIEIRGQRFLDKAILPN